MSVSNNYYYRPLLPAKTYNFLTLPIKFMQKVHKNCYNRNKPSIRKELLRYTVDIACKNNLKLEKKCNKIPFLTPYWSFKLHLYDLTVITAINFIWPS